MESRVQVLERILSAVEQDLVNHRSLPEALDIHLKRASPSSATQRLHWAVSPTTVTHYLLRVDAQGDQGVQRNAAVHVLFRRTWCCPRAKVTVPAMAQLGLWSTHVLVRLRHSSDCCTLAQVLTYTTLIHFISSRRDRTYRVSNTQITFHFPAGTT